MVKTATEPAEATEQAEVKVAEMSFEDALAPKTERVKSDGDRLGLYLVRTGVEARVIRAALVKVGETNYSAYLQRLVLADLKSRLNGTK